MDAVNELLAASSTRESAAMTVEETLAELRRIGIEEPLLAEIAQCLRLAEDARFGGETLPESLGTVQLADLLQGLAQRLSRSGAHS